VEIGAGGEHINRELDKIHSDKGLDHSNDNLSQDNKQKCLIISPEQPGHSADVDHSGFQFIKPFHNGTPLYTL
jgi:hypothetical protein